MDLSALIFVALAVAWATYLIPKALRQHEDSSASRHVEGFSARLRVLARREPVDGRSARLVVEPGRPASTAVPVPDPAEREPARPSLPPAVRRAAAARAARRRLRVVLTILLAGVVVGGLAVAGVVGAVWLAVPAGVLVAWLVACRLMVKRERERAVSAPGRRLPFVTQDPAPVEDDTTEEIVAVRVEVELAEEAAFHAAREASTRPVDPHAQAAAPEPAEAPEQGWDPVPTTLPTYVDKAPAARRSVRTIDLDATGVWTSGPLAADSALAREADEERRTARQAPSAQTEAERRASGS